MHHSRRSCWACTKIRKVEHRYPEVTPAQNLAENECEFCELGSTEDVARPCLHPLSWDDDPEEYWRAAL